MISKNKQRGSSLFEIMIIFVLFFIVTFTVASFIGNDKTTTTPSQSQAIAIKPEVKKDVKYERIQPIVTEIIDYRRQPKQNKDFKLMPVVNPEMRTEPIQPVAPEPVVVTPPPAPIIEQTENHYHFEDLNTGLMYLGSIVLTMFSLFYAFKGAGKLMVTLTIKKAIKNSKFIQEAFSNDVNDHTTYLDYSRKYNDQLSLNRLIIDRYNDNYYAGELKIHTEHLASSLSFIERMFVADMNNPS